MSEGSVVAILLGVLALIGVVTTALTGLQAAKISAARREVAAMSTDLAAVKHEVKNNHTENMREELDGRHGETTGKLDEQGEKIDYLVDAFAWMLPRVKALTARVIDLEDTINPNDERETDHDDPYRPSRADAARGVELTRRQRRTARTAYIPPQPRGFGGA